MALASRVLLLGVLAQVRKTHILRVSPQAARRLIPLFDRVLVERILPEAVRSACKHLATLTDQVRCWFMQKTKGGILLPEAAKPALNEAVVVAVGEGMRTEVSSSPKPAGCGLFC
jgi:co-chaperonin GroES (HSP10)